MVRLPVTAPAAFGANVTGMARVWPEVRVLGSVMAVMVNPVPEIARELMVSEPAPDEVSVTDSDLVVPLFTLPKLRDVGDREICGVAATPVPDKATVDLAPLVELLPIVNVPVTAPAVLGANVTGITRVWPEVRVFGRVIAVMLNPLPEIARELIVREPVPEEVRVTDNALELPFVTLPKLSEAGLTAI